MKKQFVTALVLALGISGTALAANPFSDGSRWSLGLCRGCQAGRGRDCRWLS